MNLSKDIMRHLIENYFHLTEIYQCQFVSKFVRSCITPQQLYKSQCNKVALNMQKKQNKYLIKRRKENIEYFVDLKISLLNDGSNHMYLRKKLIEKYTNQKGDTFCYKCNRHAIPDVITKHFCTGKQLSKCKDCGCENPNEFKSPHRQENCPLFSEGNMCINCDLKNVASLYIKHHCCCKGTVYYGDFGLVSCGCRK